MQKYSYEEIEKKGVAVVNINLIDNILNLVYETAEEFKQEKMFDYPSQLEAIVADIKKHSLELAPTLDKPINERQGFINELVNTKTALIDFARSVFLYYNALENCNRSITHKYKLYQIKSLEKFPVDKSLFMQDIKNYISLTDMQPDKSYSMSELLSIIPLRMTKDKYADYVKHSFRYIFKGFTQNLAENSLNLFKEKLSPQNSDNYAKYFTFINDEIEKIKNADTKSYTPNEYETAITKIEELNDTVSEIASNLNTYYNRLNYIYNLAAFAIDQDYLFEDFTVKDMYYSMCDMLKTGDYETIVDSVLQTTGDKIEELYIASKDEVKAFEDMIAKLMSSQAEDIPESTLIVLGTYQTIRSNFYREISDDFITNIGSEELADNSYIDSVAERFIQYLNSNISTLPISEQKFIKQNLMRNMAYPFSDKEYMDYIDYAFDGMGESDLAYVTYLNVFDYYEATGYTPNALLEDDCDCEDDHHHHHDHSHHHHDHGHNCSCGHHHH